MTKVSSVTSTDAPEFQRSGQQPGRFALAVPLLILGLLAVPLLINPGVFATFEETYLTPRLWWLYSIVLPAALLTVSNWVPRWQAAQLLLGLLAAWLVWQTLSVAVTGAGWNGWWGYPQRADGVLMHVLYGLLVLCGWQWRHNDPQWAPAFARSVLCGGALLALTNIAQQLHLAGVPNANAFSGVMPTTMGGTLGNRGYLGGALACYLPLCLWSWQVLGHNSGTSSTSARRWAHLFPALAVMLVTWGWLGSFTRGAWLAGALSLGWWAVLQYRQRQCGLLRRWWLPLLAGLGLFAGTTAVFGNARTFTPNGKQGLLAGSGREALWKAAALGIEQQPAFGWGTPALFRVMNIQPLEELAWESGYSGTPISPRMNAADESPTFRIRQADGRVQTVSNFPDKVHNEYLDHALTYGLPAALLLCTLLILGIWNSRTAPGISAALLAYGLYLLTWPDSIRFSPLLWFVLGLAWAQGVRPAHPISGRAL
ncbi:O-antigen ligase family protein [Deinococcus sp. SL84]|uniref:O-antigen ligase family protein n=1 Tax=Deinococcus sp. SL84 TaxID=2994663 RepID=UPI002276EFA3|nr:O-antigen ligase family protein [Deinococcus sp. SL84]MCY1703072.1 O-antigen ligase family protein [Deinococcus sp. SL84]